MRRAYRLCKSAADVSVDWTKGHRRHWERWNSICVVSQKGIVGFGYESGTSISVTNVAT